MEETRTREEQVADFEKAADAWEKLMIEAIDAVIKRDPDADDLVKHAQDAKSDMWHELMTPTISANRSDEILVENENENVE